MEGQNSEKIKPVPEEIIQRMKGVLYEMTAEIEKVKSEDNGYSADTKEFVGTFQADINFYSSVYRCKW